jgi:hypothetical protein
VKELSERGDLRWYSLLQPRDFPNPNSKIVASVYALSGGLGLSGRYLFHWSLAKTLVYSIVGAILLIYAVQSWFSGLDVADDGIVLVKGRSIRRIPWEEIGYFEAAGPYFLRIRLRHDGQISLRYSWFKRTREAHISELTRLHREHLQAS